MLVAGFAQRFMYVLIIKRLKLVANEDEVHKEILANFMLRSIMISILCSPLVFVALFVA